ncbi:hypothetical protein EVAR_71478_1 [Eumeta japonica]|uniref:Uncharacterized protein n=1 Tax=Eumeta variegata TaxID=151549 RepID=A0A4C1SIV2_EUMVA|nr:hypothetical protein EVAR_71478_1 [Eumeta japonica]
MPRVVILLTLWAVTLLFFTRLIFTGSDKGCCLRYAVEGEPTTEKAVDAPIDCEATCYLYITRSASRKDTTIRDNNAIHEVDKYNATIDDGNKSINRNSTLEKDKINPYVNVLFDFCDYIKKKVYNKWKNTLLNFKRLSVPKGSSRKWNLRSVSLFRRNSIVVCELIWLPQMALALYHVTWEVEGEWVKGHTFTDVARVKLSLGPDTKYKVTVRLLLSARLESESLIIDTGKVSDDAEGADAVTYANNNDISIAIINLSTTGPAGGRGRGAGAGDDRRPIASIGLSA